MTTISLELVRVDGGTQARAALSDDTVREYTEAIETGATFPPLVVFYDGATYWLADGFHRRAAYEQAGRFEVAVEVHQGTRRDAQLYSFGANETHGLRRSNADRWRVVEAMLADPEWSTWSDREIARQCNVSHPFVAKVRRSTGNVTSSRRGADGKVRALPSALPAGPAMAGECDGVMVSLCESTAQPGYFWIEVIDGRGCLDGGAEVTHLTKPARRDALRSLLADGLRVPVERVAWIECDPAALPLAGRFEPAPWHLAWGA